MSTLDRNKEIAETIVQQIGNRSFYMIGAKQFVVRECGLSFCLMRNPKKATFILIQLTPYDDYKITTVRRRKHAGKISDEIIGECDGVYVEELHSTLEDMTGLSFRMPRILTAIP